MEKSYPNLRVVLTLGKKGSLYQADGRRAYQPIFKVNAVDTTAAGDTFTGYFLSGLVRGDSPREMLRMASCASAISVSRNGAAPSIPLREEVMERIGVMTEETPMLNSDHIRRRIEDYIDNNINTASLSGLSEILNYTVSYTGNLVKKQLGKSFGDILREKRLSYAARLLSEGKLSVDEIIRLAGYRNESFFRKLFLKKYGISPLQYRRRKSVH